MKSTGKAIGVTPKNIDEQIGECKAEIAKLEVGGTIISAVINFAQESGKALFSSVSSSDEDKKDLHLEKSKSQGQDGESSDSPDGLSEEKLTGHLADYVKQLKEAGTEHKIVNKNGMVAVEVTMKGSDPNSMRGMFGGLVKEFNRKMTDGFIAHIEKTGLSDNVKSQVTQLLRGLNNLGGINSGGQVTNEESAQKPEAENQGKDSENWYDGDQVLNATRNNAKMDRDDKNDNSELLGVTQSEIFEMQIEDAKRIADKGKTALMPINIGGNHWVAGAMTKKDDKYQIIHNDSLGSPIDEKLSKTLGKNGVGIVDLQQRQQEDLYNCGPFAADNLVKFSKAIEASKESSLDISSEEFKRGLSEELGKDGDEIRRGQNLSPPNTPEVPGKQVQVGGRSR